MGSVYNLAASAPSSKRSGIAWRRAPIHGEIHGGRRELNEPGALEWRHVNAADPDLPSTRNYLHVVEDAMDAVPAKRTVEKEDEKTVPMVMNRSKSAASPSTNCVRSRLS
jgi:hypothetical protein